MLNRCGGEVKCHCGKIQRTFFFPFALIVALTPAPCEAWSNKPVLLLSKVNHSLWVVVTWI